MTSQPKWEGFGRPNNLSSIAALEAVEDERTDEIVVSTFPGERSGWLRRDLVGRLREETGHPVDHVVAEQAEVPA